MEWQAELSRLIQRQKRGDFAYDSNWLFMRLYLLLREADLDTVVSELRSVGLDEAFVAYLRDLHGSRPRYDVMFVSNLQPDPDPRELVEFIHEWLKMH